MKDLLISVDCDYTYHIHTRDKHTDFNYMSYDSQTQTDKDGKAVNFLEKALTVSDTSTC